MVRKFMSPTRFILLSLLAIWTAGCIGPSVYTTRNTSLPVMLGPIKNIQAQEPADLGPVVESFASEIVQSFIFLAVSSRYGGYVTTAVVANSYGEPSAKFDNSVMDATAACQQCTVKTERVEVGAYSLLWTWIIVNKNWAGMLATVHDIGQ